MAQLIQMRQRIKAIETIKKITHAMRLISMSLHSRLRSKAPLLANYQKEIAAMFEKVRFAAPKWRNRIMHPKTDAKSNPLVIFVASQKGLCGNFNTALFREFQELIPPAKIKKINFVAVGKYAVDFFKKQETDRIVKTFDHFSSAQLNMISGRIVELISQAETPYSAVTFIANYPKSFFSQKPKSTDILPLSKDFAEGKTKRPREPYVWEQDPNEVLDDLALQFLTSQIYHLLFQSLLAEQAARFISMDNSTRNAKQLLEDTQLLYNKLRQAQITRELTELSASF